MASVTSNAQFNGSSALSTIDDYYTGRRLTFTSGTLAGKTSRIMDYVGATRTFIFNAGDGTNFTFNVAPSVNDAFRIEANRFPAARSATLDSGYDASQWLLSTIYDITMSSGRYTLSLNASNTATSIAGVSAGASGPSVWSQTDGVYQNGGKTEGPGGTPGVYLDVDGDGYVVAGDALAVINVLNSGGGGAASTYCGSHTCNPLYVDVNNEGQIAPNDALDVINYLNAGIYNAAPAGFRPIGSDDPPTDLQPSDVTADVIVQTVDMSGAPISSIQKGQQFQLQAFLVLVAPAGVVPFAGYADVAYPALRVAPVSNAADVGLVGSNVGSGLIDEAGRAMYPDSAGLMFSKTFTATKKGTATFTADAADLFGHEIYVTGLSGPLPWSQVTFGSATLVIE